MGPVAHTATECRGYNERGCDLGAVGGASRSTCRKFHRPAAAFYSTQPAGARAGAPEGGRGPRDLENGGGAATWDDDGRDARPTWIGTMWAGLVEWAAHSTGERRPRFLNGGGDAWIFIGGLGTSFDGGWCGLAGWERGRRRSLGRGRHERGARCRVGKHSVILLTNKS